MIPYFYYPTITLGPITIFTWGLFVGLGLLIGYFIARRAIIEKGLDVVIFEKIALYMIIAGFVGARLGHVLFYERGYFLTEPMKVFAIWEGGMSSFGGLIAAGFVGLYFWKKENIDYWLYADCTMFGLTAGWTIGRVGCFLIHDHPGTASDFFLAAKDKDGIARHDLGLYDGIVSLLLFDMMWQLTKFGKLRSGLVTLFVIAMYSTARFFLDFLRVADTRHFGLTFAQYASVGLFVWVLVMLRRRASPAIPPSNSVIG